MTRQPPADLEIREVPVDDPDVAAMIAVRDAVRPDDRMSVDTWNDLGRKVDWTFDLVARRGGVPVAMGGAAPLIFQMGSDACWTELCVLAEHRGQGIGGHLLRLLSRGAAAHGKRELRTHVREDEPEPIAFLERRGFARVSRDQDSELELAASDVRRVDAPPGVRITTLAAEPELTEGLYAVALEAEPDMPSEEQAVVPPFERWREHTLERPTVPPEAQFAAVADDGTVLGYALLSLSDVEEGLAYHQMTATARAARGRGVASALKRAAILWARDERGLRVLRTSNEERNAPMLAINRRLGYRPLPAWLGMRGPLVLD